MMTNSSMIGSDLVKAGFNNLNYFGIFNNLELTNDSQEIKKIDWPSSPSQEMIDQFSKMPIIEQEKFEGSIVFDSKTKLPDKIEKSYIHKSCQENVLLSKPKKIGQIWYFNMYKKTEEINFDHPSDHVQGMLIMEAVRQASIATTHLNGCPLKSVITLRKFNIDFIDFIFESEPIIIRTLSRPVFLRNGKFFQYVLLNIIQSNKVCASAIVQGMVFENNQIMERFLSLIKKS